MLILYWEFWLVYQCKVLHYDGTAVGGQVKVLSLSLGLTWSIKYIHGCWTGLSFCSAWYFISNGVKCFVAIFFCHRRVFFLPSDHSIELMNAQSCDFCFYLVIYVIDCS